jgi:hypothetical protein
MRQSQMIRLRAATLGNLLLQGENGIGTSNFNCACAAIGVLDKYLFGRFQNSELVQKAVDVICTEPDSKYYSCQKWENGNSGRNSTSKTVPWELASNC